MSFQVKGFRNGTDEVAIGTASAAGWVIYASGDFPYFPYMNKETQ